MQALQFQLCSMWQFCGAVCDNLVVEISCWYLLCKCIRLWKAGSCLVVMARWSEHWQIKPEAWVRFLQLFFYCLMSVYNCVRLIEPSNIRWHLAVWNLQYGCSCLSDLHVHVSAFTTWALKCRMTAPIIQNGASGYNNTFLCALGQFIELVCECPFNISRFKYYTLPYVN